MEACGNGAWQSAELPQGPWAAVVVSSLVLPRLEGPSEGRTACSAAGGSLAFRRRAQKLSPTRPGRLGVPSQSARESNNAVFTGSTPLKTPIVYMVCVLYAQHPLLLLNYISYWEVVHYGPRGSKGAHT